MSEEKISRAVVEFGGPGQADVTRFTFENLSVGQVQVLAAFIQRQAERALDKMERQQVEQPALLIARPDVGQTKA